MAGSPLDVARAVESSMKATSSALRKAVKSSMVEAGKVARKEVETSGRRFTGGDLRFSNMGGARIGVRLTQVEDGVFVTSKGPWGMLQPGASAHTIGSAGRRMKIGGEWRTGPFRHPGTPNTRAWDVGREGTFDSLERVVLRRVGDEVEGAF